ncbi:hypothetical protein [Iodobacter fluviatilis]|uniref:Uncharacterized protein n=1 Tax=Iodobacter fluviatilis TaxID=537 RepID=A0A377QAI4_9NEIS|nr:hypothetical protein [Iodobacter fluviatilis]TCU83666.1 hypothetical protein EV682_11126 [Iodobacter fluviatilis]STQ91827.1 Uncharacterised protein [Iodobacter fluviatilis]
MGIFSRIKKLIGLEQQEVFRRWPASELEEKKVYLENKLSEEFTPEDHYLSAEWIIQRYLPEGDDPTPEQWSEIIADIRQKIDINLKNAAVGELVKIEYVQLEPYVITKEDFLKDVVPTFSRFDLLPDPYLKDSQGRELWTVLFEFTQQYSYKYGEAKDTLIFFCDAFQAEKLVHDLGRTYTALRCAQIEGSAKLEVVCSSKQCSDCMSLDGNKMAVEELLSAFKNEAPLFPHPLHLEDEVSWCPAPYLSPEIPLRMGDDTEFYEVLMKILER